MNFKNSLDSWLKECVHLTVRNNENYQLNKANLVTDGSLVTCYFQLFNSQLLYFIDGLSNVVENGADFSS